MTSGAPMHEKGMLGTRSECDWRKPATLCKDVASDVEEHASVEHHLALGADERRLEAQAAVLEAVVIGRALGLGGSGLKGASGSNSWWSPAHQTSRPSPKAASASEAPSAGKGRPAASTVASTAAGGSPPGNTSRPPPP